MDNSEIIKVLKDGIAIRSTRNDHALALLRDIERAAPFYDEETLYDNFMRLIEAQRAVNESLEEMNKLNLLLLNMTRHLPPEALAEFRRELEDFFDNK